MKKILSISFKVVTWLLIAFTVAMVIFTIFTVSTVDKNDRSIFGYKFYIVLSDSMKKTEKNADMDVHFNALDIVIVKEVKNRANLKAGDIVSFISTNSENYGETITHMIHERKYDEEGKFVGYVTFGTATGNLDEAVVEPSYVLGCYAGKIPAVGRFFNYIRTTPGYLLCILLPFMLLILYNGVNVIRLFRRYKKEQTAIMDAERAEIAAERKQNEDMLRELQALKAQLEMHKAASENPSDPSDDTEGK